MHAKIDTIKLTLADITDYYDQVGILWLCYSLDYNPRIYCYETSYWPNTTVIVQFPDCYADLI
jgi:hypothetical protein